MAQRFARLGFTHGITTGIAKSASVQDRFSTNCGVRCGAKRWRGTDVGTRVITAICLDDHADPSWLNGPPYAVVEAVFGEYAHPGCEPI